MRTDRNVSLMYDILTDHNQKIKENLSKFFLQLYLMDIDMSILASDEATYDKYAQAIRIEYSQYPDAIYNPGRIQVLE